MSEENQTLFITLLGVLATSVCVGMATGSVWWGLAVFFGLLTVGVKVSE